MRRIDDHQTETLFDSWGYVGPKRRKLLERGWTEVLFQTLTDQLLKVFKVPTTKQRLDSTHLLSNMKRLSRLNVLVSTIETFLKELRRVHPKRLKAHVNPETASRVEAAHERDEAAMLPMIRETQERGCGPEELLADASYGSDENVQKAAREGTEVIAPTMRSTLFMRSVKSLRYCFRLMKTSKGISFIKRYYIEIRGIGYSWG